MKRYGIWIGLLVLVLSACTDNGRLNRKEDRLIGAWEFERAFYKGNNAIFRDNLTEEFEGDIIEFLNDYTAFYDDLDANTTYFGDWELFLVRDQWDGDDEVDFFLDMYFFDDFNRPAFEYFTSVKRLNNNRLEIIALDRRGRYTFRLKKL